MVIFAVVIAVLSKSEEELQELLNGIDRLSTEYGLKPHKEKGNDQL